MKKKISITIDEHLLNEVNSLVDNITIRNTSRAIEYVLGKSLHQVKTAVLLCGGSVERQRVTATEFRPTARVLGSTAVEMALRKLHDNNFRNIFIIGMKPVLTDIFRIVGNGERYGVRIKYVEEEETEAEGSAASLRKVDHIKTPFLVAWGDIIFSRIDIESLWNTHIKGKATATLVIEATAVDPGCFGVVVMEGDRIVDYEEKPGKAAKSKLKWTGVFVAEPEIFYSPGARLQEDVFPVLAKKGLLRGFLSPFSTRHFHTVEDIRAIEKEVRRKK